MSVDLLNKLRHEILPRHYRHDFSGSVAGGMLLFKRGAYVCLVMPFDAIPSDDFGSIAAKKIIRNTFLCIPMFREKGLFLIYYGDAAAWADKASQFTVDKTALRPVILQSVHFIDPMSGQNTNTRTQWDPVKFGFCGKLIDDIEIMCRDIKA